jgi:hypothetical protein
MDGSRFDDLTRAFVISRRGALRAMAAGLAAGLGHVLAAGAQPDEDDDLADRDEEREAEMAAREEERAEGEAERETEQAAQETEEEIEPWQQEAETPQQVAEQAVDAAEQETARATGNPFQRAGKRCDRGQPCGSMAPCTNGVCTPIACKIDRLPEPVAAGTLNPDNDCQFCAPSLSNWTGWTAITGGGAPCTQATDDPCLSIHGRCSDGGGECVNFAFDDGSPCGVERVCCRGTCCEAGYCCSEQGFCGLCGEICFIGGVQYPPLARNPQHDCQWCDPERNDRGWSQVPDNIECGSTPGRICCNGVCCSPGECCSAAGLCVECCQIGDKRYPDGTRNPDNECEACIPGTSRDTWSFVDDSTPCGAAGEKNCCLGICVSCECVVDDGARVAAAGTIVCHAPCIIDGVEYQHGAANPANPCEICDSEISTEAWSDAPFLTKCGDDLDRICCHGVCCPDGQCCHDNPAWNFCSVEWCDIVDPCPHIDGPCGCTIDGQFYAHETINRNNTCEWCDAYWSTTSWTDRRNFSRCGPFGDRFCCEGVCCETGSCCNATGICEFEAPACRGCVIGDRFFYNGIRNPENGCEICDTSRSTTSWTIRPNDVVCDTIVVDDVVWNLYCCEGICCPNPEDCCSTKSGMCTPVVFGECHF